MSPLPDFVVIGAMKCGTTALHHYLAAHPGIAMPALEEVNFFFGDEPGGTGRWWRGLDFYSGLWRDDGRVRGEVSPGYTSPDHGGVAERMAALLPDVRLVYLVRDPLDRALSQHAHHVRDGTEQRPVAEALLDPEGHYLLRSRFAERLEPFRRRVPGERILVVDHADLLADRRETLSRVFAFVGADPGFWSPSFERLHNVGQCRAAGEVPQAAFLAAVADDPMAAALVRRHRGALLRDASPSHLA